MKPIDSSPASFLVPGGRASLPKTNFVQAVALSSTLTTALFMTRKT